MKELSIEEKAKRYDDVLEKLRGLHDNYDTISTLIDIKEELEHILPELAENKDEKIRKELLQIAKESEDSFYMVMTPDKRKRLIAWLEKQGGQKPAWSEEDEEKIKEIKIAIYNQYNEDKAEDLYYYFLEPILYKAQPKQEWNEEDKKISRFIGNAITANDASMYLESKGIQVIDTHVWLEELKERVQPQNRWKPSEGQLECLGYAIEKAEKDWSPLMTNRVYLTLKALKEQLEKL